MPKISNPILSEFAAQPWVMKTEHLRAFIEQISGMSISMNIASLSIQKPASKLQISDGVATIKISGVLLKTVPGWASFFGLDFTGYDDIEQQIAEAVADKQVKEIHLRISSPGGTVAGVAEAADAIYKARQVKQVTASIEDLGASGAYWLASQAGTIDANRTAEVGSIGVYTVYLDYSAYDEKAGIKVIVIRSGPHKGAGIDGVTEEQQAAVQDVIDSMADSFIESVARGRGLDDAAVRELATGRTWIASAARELKLIDAVNNESVTIDATDENDNISKGDSQMSETSTTEQPAVNVEQIQADERKRLGELKAAFPEDLEFALAQYEAGASVTEAKAAYCDVLREMQAKADQAAKAAKVATDGAEPLEHNDSSASTGQDYLSVAHALAKEKGISKTEAFKQVAKEQPELYEQYTAAARG